MSRERQAGFSMIEVLVASAILTMIVMMMGMLFQQTSAAWRTGSKRSDGFTQVRSLIGAIQRDASQAVDQYGAEKAWDAGGKGNIFSQNQSFNSSRLIFYTLSGTNRGLSKVSYETDGTRTQWELFSSGSSWAWREVAKNNVMKSIKKQANANTPSVDVSFRLPTNRKIKNPYDLSGNAQSKCLPLYLTIDARVISSGYALEVGAASAGPDRQWNTKDDITTWSKRN